MVAIGIDGFNERWVRLLERLDIPITIFFVSSWFGRKDSLIRFADVEECKKLVSKALPGRLQFGCHSATHCDLRQQPKEGSEEYAERVFREVAISKEIIETELSVRISSFALPYGVVNENDNICQLLDVCRKVGFTAVRGTAVSRRWRLAGVLPHHYEAKYCHSKHGLKLSLGEYDNSALRLCCGAAFHQLDVFLSLTQRIGVFSKLVII